jgi:hypothetical protein
LLLLYLQAAKKSSKNILEISCVALAQIGKVGLAMEQPFGQSLVAGDTWSWTVDLSNESVPYSPSAGYVLKYFFRGAQNLTVQATASGSAFLVTASPTQTGALPPGTYSWQAVVYLNTDRTELARGTVTVLPDVEAQDAGVETRSWVKQSLDAVRAVIANRASRIEKEYQIAGRMLMLLAPEELLKLEGELTERYQKELRDSGQIARNNNKVVARFV